MGVMESLPFNQNMRWQRDGHLLLRRVHIHQKPQHQINTQSDGEGGANHFFQSGAFSGCHDGVS